MYCLNTAISSCIEHQHPSACSNGEQASEKHLLLCEGSKSCFSACNCAPCSVKSLMICCLCRRRCTHLDSHSLS